MLLKAEKYREMIQTQTKRFMLFPNHKNQGEKPFRPRQSSTLLPSLNPFRSSQQIDNDFPITHRINHEISNQGIVKSFNEWPQSCIGLVLCEHHQNNQTFYVYGTGTLIHQQKVLTNAQNVYCRRLHTQYTNIKFITGVSGTKCSGIYDIKRLYYPKQYTMQEQNDYDFAVLYLYNTLIYSCGYVGLKTIDNIKEDNQLIRYEYLFNDKEGSFKLQQTVKVKNLKQDDEICSSSGVLMKEKNKYYIIGMHTRGRDYNILREAKKNIINQQTHMNFLDLGYKDIDAQGCMYLSQTNLTNLFLVDLRRNSIDVSGCKYLSQTNWKYLNQIFLGRNNIDGQGCKYLSQANCIHLTFIDLSQNKIGNDGCKYLCQTNWAHLDTIKLYNNNISAQGYKYLSQTNWIYLTSVDLWPEDFIDEINDIIVKQLWPNARISK